MANDIITSKGNLNEAITNYHLAATLCPPKYNKELAIYYNNIGMLFMRMKKMKEAEV